MRTVLHLMVWAVIGAALLALAIRRDALTAQPAALTLHHSPLTPHLPRPAEVR